MFKINKIAGVDEVGRGCLAGPVFAAAVILSSKVDKKLLIDSKKISYNEIDLSDDSERLKFYEKIGENVKTVPQVFIDDKRIGGFQDLKVFLDE